MPKDLKQLEESARAIAPLIVSNLPGEKGEVGFALLMFDFGGGGHITYIGNAVRSDMVKSVRELMAKWEVEFPSNGWESRRLEAAASAIANARGARAGAPPVLNVLSTLPKNLLDACLEDAMHALLAASKVLP